MKILKVCLPFWFWLHCFSCWCLYAANFNKQNAKFVYRTLYVYFKYSAEHNAHCSSSLLSDALQNQCGGETLLFFMFCLQEEILFLSIQGINIDGDRNWSNLHYVRKKKRPCPSIVSSHDNGFRIAPSQNWESIDCDDDSQVAFTTVICTLQKCIFI